MTNAQQLADEILARGVVTTPGRPCTDAHLREYGGRLPDVVLELWRRVGFARLLDGAVWLVDPSEWSDEVVDLMRGVSAIRGLPPGSPIVPVARTAFGAFWFHSPGHGICFQISPAEGRLSSRVHRHEPAQADIVAFSWFAMLTSAAVDVYDRAGEGLLARAHERLGPVGEYECYGFTPSLLLGGDTDVDGLRRAPIREHLRVLDRIRRGAFTAQAGPPR